MHEVELANRVLEAVRGIASEQKGKLKKVNLKVGELNEPDSLDFWLKKLGGSEFVGVEFNIERVPLRIKCDCGYSGGVNTPVDPHSPAPELELVCPKCEGRCSVSLESGRELEIVSVEMEAPRDE
jgi:Zn finger protein HypA/HybF involved in hydrogenase expression